MKTSTYKEAEEFLKKEGFRLHQTNIGETPFWRFESKVQYAYITRIKENEFEITYYERTDNGESKNTDICVGEKEKEENNISKLEFIMLEYANYCLENQDIPIILTAKQYIEKLYPEFLELELVHKAIIK